VSFKYRYNFFLGSLSSEEDFSECGKNDFFRSKFIAGATNDLGKTFNQKQIITIVKCFIVYPPTQIAYTVEAA
jgi:hypothetical protein